MWRYDDETGRALYPSLEGGSDYVIQLQRSALVSVHSKEDYSFKTLIKGRWNYSLTKSLRETIDDVVGYMKHRSSLVIDGWTVRSVLRNLTSNDNLPSVKIFTKHLKALGH